MKDVLKTQGEGVEIKSRAVPQSAIDHFRWVNVLPAEPSRIVSFGGNECVASATPCRFMYHELLG